MPCTNLPDMTNTVFNLTTRNPKQINTKKMLKMKCYSDFLLGS